MISKDAALIISSRSDSGFCVNLGQLVSIQAIFFFNPGEFVSTKVNFSILSSKREIDDRLKQVKPGLNKLTKFGTGLT